MKDVGTGHFNSFKGADNAESKLSKPQSDVKVDQINEMVLNS